MLHTKELTILLIEDNPIDVLLIRNLLGKMELMQVKLLLAENLEQAVAQLQEANHAPGSIDVVLLDLLLPDTRDTFSYSQIREWCIGIPVIVLSGINDKAVSLQAIQEGAQDYLIKGDFNASLLEKTIFYAIERNKLVRQQASLTQELQAHDKLLRLITQISTTFINLSSEQIDEAMTQALEAVGRFLEADRAFILEILPSERRTTGADGLGSFSPGVYEWSVSHLPKLSDECVRTGGLCSFQAALQNFQEARNELRESGLYSFNTLAELPAAEEGLKKLLGIYRIESLLLVSIYYEKKLAGIFGLASSQAYKLWNAETISLLNPSGEIFYRAIKKKQAEEAVKESEKKYRALVENMNEGLVYLDATGRIQFVNDRIFQMFGYAAEELVGKHAVNPALLGEEHCAFLLRKLRFNRGMLRHYEMPIRTKQHGNVWVLVNGHAVFSDEGILVGTMATLIDISDRKKAEDKLTRVNQELKTFIYRASHDLRGPLASVLGLTNLAQMQVQDEDALRFFEYIRTSVFKLDRTLKALTDVASITQMAEDFTPVDMEEVVGEVWANVSEELRADVHFEATVRQPVRLVSSRLPVKYILENLIDNSLKYRSPERTLRIEVSVQVNEKQAEIEITDNGVGIADSLQHRVFDMFFRGNEKSRGSGLGLYVVDKLVASLHGQVRLTSVEGKGTTVHVHLRNMA